jgi:hypothetical protein
LRPHFEHAGTRDNEPESPFIEQLSVEITASSERVDFSDLKVFKVRGDGNVLSCDSRCARSLFGVWRQTSS